MATSRRQPLQRTWSWRVSDGTCRQMFHGSAGVWRPLAAACAASFVALYATSANAAPACPLLSTEELTAHADVVFIGVALPGEVDGAYALTSPALFEVEEYLKGTGGDTVAVATATDSDVPRSYGFYPRAGQVWKVFAGPANSDGVVPTGLCSGSELLGTIGTYPLSNATAHTSASPAATVSDHQPDASLASPLSGEHAGRPSPPGPETSSASGGLPLLAALTAAGLGAAAIYLTVHLRGKSRRTRTARAADVLP